MPPHIRTTVQDVKTAFPDEMYNHYSVGETHCYSDMRNPLREGGAYNSRVPKPINDPKDPVKASDKRN